VNDITIGQRVHFEKGLEITNRAIAFSKGTRVLEVEHVNEELARNICNLDRVIGRILWVVAEQCVEVLVANTQNMPVRLVNAAAVKLKGYVTQRLRLEQAIEVLRQRNPINVKLQQ
jgi:hypothetical protein